MNTYLYTVIPVMLGYAPVIRGLDYVVLPSLLPEPVNGGGRVVVA